MADKQDGIKKIDTSRASLLYNKDQRTIRRWCEQGRLEAELDHGGNWIIYIPLKEYQLKMADLHA